MKDQRASGGTQKMLSAVYSSRSSASAPFSFCNSACLSSNASEMYFMKIRPRTTCLYSAASRLPRSLSAVAQSVASKPRAEPLVHFPVLIFGTLRMVLAARAMATAKPSISTLDQRLGDAAHVRAMVGDGDTGLAILRRLRPEKDRFRIHCLAIKAKRGIKPDKAQGFDSPPTASGSSY